MLGEIVERHGQDKARQSSISYLCLLLPLHLSLSIYDCCSIYLLPLSFSRFLSLFLLLLFFLSLSHLFVSSPSSLLLLYSLSLSLSLTPNLSTSVITSLYHWFSSFQVRTTCVNNSVITSEGIRLRCTHTYIFTCGYLLMSWCLHNLSLICQNKEKAHEGKESCNALSACVKWHQYKKRFCWFLKG